MRLEFFIVANNIEHSTISNESQVFLESGNLSTALYSLEVCLEVLVL